MLEITAKKAIHGPTLRIMPTATPQWVEKLAYFRPIDTIGVSLTYTWVTGMAVIGQTQVPPLAWPHCSGAMADQIRAKDWHETPLGSPDQWPQALKTAVEIMLQSMRPGCVCWGPALTTIFNDAAKPQVELEHPTPLGRPYAEIWARYWPEVEPAVTAALAGRSTSITRANVGMQTANHPANWFTFTWSPLRDAVGHIAGFYVTVTETTLQFSDDLLHTILQNTRDAVSMLDLASGRYVFINQAHATLTGFSIDELSQLGPADFLTRVHPEDRANLAHPMDWINTPPADFEDAREYRCKIKNGEYRWYSTTRKIVRDNGGGPVAVVNVSRDITNAKKAEAELRQSEARYRSLHESLRDGFVRITMDGNFLDCNSVYSEMLGYSKAELLKLKCLDLTPSRWHAPEDAIIANQVLVRGYSDVYEKEYRHKSGKIFPVELRAVLDRDDMGNPVSMWAIVRDISERRAQEAHHAALNEQLIHAARVHELGQVSAGIAHELNQPLAAIQNYAATAKRLIARGDATAASQAIARASEQASRAGEIIRRMRDFVEKRDTNKQRGDVNAMVQEAAALGLIGAKAVGIETRYNLAPGLPAVIADRVQIEQVLVNLLHNAMDAMAEEPERVLTLSSRQNDGAVEIIVDDSGRGILESVVHRLFQPFVTSKPQGMGIGLAISKSIIEAHGGEIFAEPNPSGGTRFRLRLPPAPPLE